MTSVALDVRAMPDEGLLSLYCRSDEQAAAALAEAARRDRADKDARDREQIRGEWRNAALADYAAASASMTCKSTMFSREGLANGPADEFSLWSGPEDVARKYASPELCEWWDRFGRMTVTRYTEQRARAVRAAREDTTEEAGNVDRVDTDRRPGVDVDARPGLRPGGGPDAVRRAGNAEVTEASTGSGGGAATGSVQRGGRVNAIVDGARIEEHLARGAMQAAERLRQARDSAGVARGQQGGSVALRAPRTVMVPRELDGAQLLKDTYVALNHFAIWPSEASLVTATLWPAQAHAKDEKTGLPCWQYSPRLFLTSEAGGSGKSWMGRLISKLSPDGETLIEPTKASLIQMISERKTVTITEADVLFGAGGRNRGIVGVLNAGYEPDRSHTRMRGRQAELVPLFGPVILDGLESLIKSTGPDLKTLVSRCIIIKVRRGPDGYRPPRFDKTARAVFARGGEKLAQWMAQQVRAGIGDVVPEVPEGLGNRPAALWEPLFAVADAAGGTWPDRARQACADLESAAEVDEDDEQEDEYRAALSEWADEPVFTGTEEA